MSTLPDIKTNDVPNMVEQPVVQKVDHRPAKNFKKPVEKIRKKVSERLKLKWFHKPIIGHGSNYDQPINLIENDAGTLTQKDYAIVSNSKHGTCLKSKKSRSNKSKNPFLVDQVEDSAMVFVTFFVLYVSLCNALCGFIL